VPLSNCPFPERTPKTVDDFFYLPRYKDNYPRQNSWNLVNGVRIEQKDGVSHDKPKFVKAGPGELRCGSKLKTPLSNQSFLFLRFVFF
jgi:hypothetical protein